MRNFDYESAASFEEASTLLKNTESGKAVTIAGGTDLVGVMKEKILRDIIIVVRKVILRSNVSS